MIDKLLLIDLKIGYIYIQLFIQFACDVRTGPCTWHGIDTSLGMSHLGSPFRRRGKEWVEALLLNKMGGKTGHAIADAGIDLW